MPPGPTPELAELSDASSSALTHPTEATTQASLSAPRQRKMPPPAFGGRPAMLGSGLKPW